MSIEELIEFHKKLGRAQPQTFNCALIDKSMLVRKDLYKFVCKHKDMFTYDEIEIFKASTSPNGLSLLMNRNKIRRLSGVKIGVKHEQTCKQKSASKGISRKKASLSKTKSRARATRTKKKSKPILTKHAK